MGRWSDSRWMGMWVYGWVDEPVSSRNNSETVT